MPAAEPTVAQVTAALERLGVDATVAGRLVDAVCRRWAEPHRHYHTTTHLEEVVAEVVRLGPHAAPDVRDDVLVAALWHDAVYDPTAADNEDRSAAVARADLANLVAADRCARVCELIRFTAGHDADPADARQCLLHDADLWILAAPADRYREYVTQVRREYAHVTDEDFAAGRAAVLTPLRARIAERGYLVGPPSDRAARRTRALANLTRELSRLTA